MGGQGVVVKGTEGEGQIYFSSLRPRPGDHKPCLARDADTSSASVASWGESTMLMLPVEETLLRRRGEASPETVGDL